MTKNNLKQAIEERRKQIIEMLLIDSENEPIEDFILDIKAISKAKTFKDICNLSMRNYREEIKNLREQLNEI